MKRLLILAAVCVPVGALSGPTPGTSDASAAMPITPPTISTTEKLPGQSATLARAFVVAKTMMTSHPSAAPALHPFFDHLAQLDERGLPVIGMQAGDAPRIPLVKDLTIIRAQDGGPTQGDYEGSIRVDAVDAQSVTLISSGLGLEIDTRMTRATMRDARTYREVWTTADPEVIAGATSMMVSSAVLTELATRGSTKMTIIPNTGTGANGGMLGQMGAMAKAVFADSASPGTPYTGTLRRIEAAAVSFALLINGHASSLPAVHATGIVVAARDSMNIEFYILDDPALPIVLQSGAVGGEGGRVVKITYPDSTVRSRLEQQLASKRPAQVYDIYFDYNEATITPQSDAALRDVADVMRRHPDWRLDIVGHTDSIGGAGRGNVTLSARRATAISDAQTNRYGIAAMRLTSRGAGGSDPVATNATLAGRALNRRVELRRL